LIFKFNLTIFQVIHVSQVLVNERKSKAIYSTLIKKSRMAFSADSQQLGVISMSSTLDYVVQLNDRAATVEELSPLAFSGYAHFTAMQVRSRKIRGLDLHLARLRDASREMFGKTISDEQLRSYLKKALHSSPDDISMTATIYSPIGEFTAREDDSIPQVLIRTGPASNGPTGPLTLKTFEHERVLPTLKHVGEIAKTHFLRQATSRGFDDAIFQDSRGRLSEGSIWNLAFWDGDTVVWPQAPMLMGTTMSIVRRQLKRMGIPQREQEITEKSLLQLSGAVVMNSWTPGVPVHKINSVSLNKAPFFLELLHKAFLAEPLISP
jgi:branched-subunit amino acid aminotransferase/4-amino-4-deoxychorismate lyase